MGMEWEGIKINLKATNMDLSDPVTDYVIKKATNLGKILKKIQDAGGEVMMNFEVGRTTNHHKSGQVYKADSHVTIDGEQFYASSEQDDLYAAIDDCKDKLFAEIKKKKDKTKALYKRGAQKLKDMVRSAKFWK